MLFGYELKKILKRISPILVAILLVAIAATTAIITACAFNHAPETPQDTTATYQALATKITNWNIEQQTQNAAAFETFYDNYKKLNRSATFQDSDLVTNYNAAYQAFQNFYQDYQSQDQIADYLLTRNHHRDELATIMQSLNDYFDSEKTTTADDRKKIMNGLVVNQLFDDDDLNTILANILVQQIDEDELTELKNFFVTYPAGDSQYNYRAAYDYIHNRYYLALNQSMQDVENFTGNLADYDGFEDYAGVLTTKHNITLAEYALQHHGQNYVQPFAFGDIFNGQKNVSLFDFLFTNLEMAAIPLLIIVVIWAACAFFTDTYQNTIITSLAATKRRTPIIITKTLVVLVLSATALLGLILAYVLIGLIFFHASISANILFLFNGTTATVMSSANYFVLYCLGLIFKLLPFIAICGIYSFAKTKPQIIVGLTILTFALILICNALLGNFEFYQYVPLLALDPIRYFGAKLMVSPTPPVYNLWYNLPVMVVIIVYLYWQLIHNFKRRDFK